LVRDRAAVLTVRAAVRGVIDYSQARLLDPDWWRRHYILVKEMEREDDLRLYERVLSQYQALVSNSGLTEESFKKTQDSAHDAFQDILCLLRPWEGATASERKQREVTDLKGLISGLSISTRMTPTGRNASGRKWRTGRPSGSGSGRRTSKAISTA
jgi:hypothetical protein